MGIPDTSLLELESIIVGFTIFCSTLLHRLEVTFKFFFFRIHFRFPYTFYTENAIEFITIAQLGGGEERDGEERRGNRRNYPT